MQPLYDNLNVIRNQYSDEDGEGKKIQQMLENEKLLITPLAYIRGRSLQKIYFIVEDARISRRMRSKQLLRGQVKDQGSFSR